MDLDDMLSITKKLSFPEAIEVLKCYKVLPCPDFNIFTGFIKQKEMHHNVNPFGVLNKEYP